jgi:hypothetical protein
MFLQLSTWVHRIIIDSSVNTIVPECDGGDEPAYRASAFGCTSSSLEDVKLRTSPESSDNCAEDASNWVVDAEE